MKIENETRSEATKRNKSLQTGSLSSYFALGPRLYIRSTLPLLHVYEKLRGNIVNGVRYPLISFPRSYSCSIV